MRARWFAVLALLLAGCGEPECPADTFSHIRTCVFKVSCNFNSCHNAESAKNHPNQLDLETNPYEDLMREEIDPVAAEKRAWVPPPNWRRVTPGDEMRSFLWIKLTLPTNKDPQLGDHMPDTNQSIDDETLVQILRWIRAGAQNN